MEKIQKDIYEGYVWMSDQSSPKVIFGEFELDFELCNKNFVIEAQLFSAESNTSYSVKFVDGEYIVNKYDLNAMEGVKERKKFIANRMDGHTTLCFDQYWVEEPDKYCMNMKTLKPAALVFMGFDK